GHGPEAIFTFEQGRLGASALSDVVEEDQLAVAYRRAEDLHDPNSSVPARQPVLFNSISRAAAGEARALSPPAHYPLPVLLFGKSPLPPRIRLGCIFQRIAECLNKPLVHIPDGAPLIRERHGDRHFLNQLQNFRLASPECIRTLLFLGDIAYDADQPA